MRFPQNPGVLPPQFAYEHFAAGFNSHVSGAKEDVPLLPYQGI